MANSNQVAAIVLTLAPAISGCSQGGGVPILVPEQEVIELGECLVGWLKNVTIKVANHGTGELVIKGSSSGIIIIRSPARELKIGRVEGSEPWFVATTDRPNSGIARITVKQTLSLPAGIHTGNVAVDVQAPREQRISIPVSFTRMPKERTE